MRLENARWGKSFEVQLDTYGRYDNPWSDSGFPADDISFVYDDKYLKLNFGAATREVN